MKSRPKRLFAAIILAVLAALVLALPAISVTPAAETTTSNEARALVTFKTFMMGEKEVPGPGDDDGSGTAKIEVFKTRVCHTLEFDNIEPATRAHIHIGFRDEPGPITLTLFETPDSPIPSPGTSTGCQDVPRALSLALRDNPGRYYVNVHNADFPAGAIRGQLHK